MRARLLAVLLVLGAAGPAFAEEPSAATFRTGAYQEEIAGDLPAALAAYQRVIADKDAPPALIAQARLRAGGCLELLNRGPEAIPLYAAVLRDAPVDLGALRADARRRIAALERRDAPPPASEAADALIDRLESDDPDDRYRAIGALRAASPADVVPALVRRLDRESPKVRHYAVILLGHLRDAAAIPALRARLEDPVPEIRCNAALSLLKLGDRAGRDTLAAELASPNPAVRSLAAAHLAHFGDESAVPVLLQDAESEDAFTRSTAIQALERLYGEGWREKAKPGEARPR